MVEMKYNRSLRYVILCVLLASWGCCNGTLNEWVNVIVTVYWHKHYLHTHKASAVPNWYSDLRSPPRLRRRHRGAKCFLNLICPSVRETLRSSVWVGHTHTHTFTHTHIHSLLWQISVEIFCVRLKPSFESPLAVSRCQCSLSFFSFQRLYSLFCLCWSQNQQKGQQ